jgi:hypothetical protein
MPQLILLCLVVYGGWYVWKALKKEMSRVSREVEAVRKAPTETLERDPQTGRYKLKDKA